MNTNDIVMRLREAGGGYFVSMLHNQAADEIERLRRLLLAAENEVDIYRILLEKKEKEC